MKERNPLDTAITIAAIIFFASITILLGYGTYWFIQSIDHWIAWVIVAFAYSGAFIAVIAPFANKGRE